MPFLTAFSMLLRGMDRPRALFIASRRRGFMSGSPPASLAATVISLANFENNLARFLSWAPLRCWMFAHLECPAMATLL